MHFPYTFYVTKKHHHRHSRSSWSAAGRVMLRVQGTYLLVTGVWPLLHLSSFTAVTGPKTDLWLVRTVGGLTAGIGAALLSAAVRRRIFFEIRALAFISALVFCAVGFFYVANGTIARTYLWDSFTQSFFTAFWFTFLFYYRR